jgi:uncharacterized protein with GYD domain
MPRYLIQAAYTSEAVATLVRSPQERQTGLRAVLERLGAQLETFDYSLGDYDIATIMTAPDNATTVAVAMAIQAAGHIKTFKTTPLLTQEEFLAAARKASAAGYQAPTGD